jgi:hypothetical protein
MLAYTGSQFRIRKAFEQVAWYVIDVHPISVRALLGSISDITYA